MPKDYFAAVLDDPAEAEALYNLAAHRLNSERQ